MFDKKRTRIQERITNLNTLGLVPADEVQLNIDVVYNSILDQFCSVVQTDSPRSIISALRLNYASKNKQISRNKDVLGADLLSPFGSAPLDENGYITDEVQFTANEREFICSYKKIIPETFKVIDTNGNEYTTKDKVTLNPVTGSVVLDASISLPVTVKYKFDIYNIDTDRNFAIFNKIYVESFAELFQYDIDTAVVLNDFKGLNLKENIDKILPEVLAHQRDHFIISKFFDAVTNKQTTLDAETTFPSTRGYSNTDFYEDVVTQIKIQENKFIQRTGVVPNVILCDPVAYSVISTSRKFIPYVSNIEKTGNLPQIVGTLGNTKIIVDQQCKQLDSTEGNIVLTYKGISETQSAAVYAEYLPVTLRTVLGMEGAGMMQTSNLYSIGSFNIVNPELIQGIKIVNINY